MELEVRIDVAAPPAAVWAVLADVATWPSWTPTMSSVVREDDGALAVGSEARIRQARIGTLRWVVTELSEGRSFTWEARRPGLRLAATHVVGPATAGGGSQVVLSVRQRGALGSLLAPLTARFGRRNIELEARGLKARGEGAG